MAGWRVWAGLWIGLGLMLPGVAAAPPTGADHFDDEIRPLLDRHCVSCHRGDKPKGKLRLDNLTADFADAPTLARWATVIERLEAGEMPPEGEPRPPEQDLRALSDWIAPRVAAASAAARATRGRTVLRRLNRVEYENTIRDLLGIRINLKEHVARATERPTASTTPARPIIRRPS